MLLICPSARADTLTLKPSADTTLLQAYPQNNFGGNEYFNSGTTQNYTKNRALLKFDVAAALPRGAKITSASLTLAVVRVPADGNTPSNFALHRLLRDWGEGMGSGHPPGQTSGLGRPAATNEATWLNRFAFTTNTWSESGGAPGVDFSTNVSGESYVYGTDFSPYTFDSTPAMVADAQSWLNQPETNFGWLMLSQSETSNFSARRFAAREDTNRAPALTLEYFIVKIDRIIASSGLVQLQFMAEAGQPYAVQYSDSPATTNWLTLINLPPPAARTFVAVTDITRAPQRCYRLLLP